MQKCCCKSINAPLVHNNYFSPIRSLPAILLNLLFILFILVISFTTTLHAWSSKQRKINIRYHLGTKTPYFTPAQAHHETPVPPQCELVHINMVARHGVRNPQYDDIETIASFKQYLDNSFEQLDRELQQLVQNNNTNGEQHHSQHAQDLQQKLQNYETLKQRYKWLFAWTNHSSEEHHHYHYKMPTNVAATTTGKASTAKTTTASEQHYSKGIFHSNFQGELVYQGELEHYHLARRMKQKYYSDLSTPYYPGVYNFQSTQVPRCGTSANAFAFGLLENTGEVGVSKYQPFFVNMTSLHEDRTLRFFKLCKKYVQHYRHSKELLKSPTSYFQQMLNTVRKNIEQKKFFNLIKLNSKHVKILWNLCAFDFAVWGSRHFCSLFDDRDVLRMELANDVSDYQLKGYGSKINYEMSCPLFNHIVGLMDRVIKNEHRQQRANFMFAHAETIYPLTCLLGLFKDRKKLSMKCYIRKRRKWKATRIAPFASNIAFLLYKCSSANETSSYQQQQQQPPVYRVKLLHNEEEFYFPGCNEMYCPLDRVKELYSEYLGDKCNFEKICEV